MNITPSSRSRCLSAAISAALSLAAGAAHADPQNGVVTSGAATISTPDANLTRIDQATSSVSIDWQSFDVAANEGVIFNQPGASSVALNRILSQDPSQILGSISANGRVFLLNPNGIIFGSSARINVGSLVASSLDLADVDAASGRYSFNTAAAQSGAIVNDGHITAASGGSVTLLGGSVLNNGLIVADYGSVNLGAGRAATLSFDADGLMRFQIDEGVLTNTNGAAAAVDNAGTIVADGGQVLMTARQANDVIARAVNNNGVIRAARIDNAGGRIRLVGPEGRVTNSGTLNASGTARGGEVQVLGEHVELKTGSLVDVSGPAAGGTALIGGSFQGSDPHILNSRDTEVQAGAVIRADATAAGNGGTAIVWSDGTTTFDGEISARALGASGNGGFAEVSGKEHLRLSGRARLGSVNGEAGTLLLDPGSVQIVDGSAATAPDADMDTFTDGWINDFLDDDGNLTILTSSSDAGGAQTITMAADADISWNSNNDLTLVAGVGIQLLGGSTISSNGAGSVLTLQAGGSVLLSELSLAGALAVTAGGSITQNAALDVAGDASFSAGTNQQILLSNVANDFGGSVALTTDGSSSVATIVNDGDLDLDTSNLDGGLNVTADGDITQSGILTVAGDAAFVSSAINGQITLTQTNAFGGNVGFTASGSSSAVSVRNGGVLELGGSTIGGNLTVNAGGITQTGSTALNVGGDAVLNTLAANQQIVLDEANSFGGTVRFAASGAGSAVTIRDSGDLVFDTSSTGGDLTATAGGNITQNAALNVGGDASFATTVTDRQVILDTATNTFGGSVGFAVAGPGGAVSIYDSGSLLLSDANVAGSFTARSNAGVAQVDGTELSIGGVASFTAGTNQQIALDEANAFSNDVVLSVAGSGSSASVNATGLLRLGTSNVGGDLDVTAGSVAQSGALTVGGDASFAAATNQVIDLSLANAFSGTVALNVSGAGSAVSVTDTGELDLAQSGIGGSLSASANSITQSGTLSVGTTSLFRAAGGQSIDLNLANTFTGDVNVQAISGTLADVTLRDTTALALGSIATSDDLTVTAAGITQIGGSTLNVGGTGTFSTAAANQAITLTQPTNSFGSARFTATGATSAVSVRDSGALELDASNVGGNLNVTAGGAITQSAALSVGGAANLRVLNDAGAAITLDETNAFGSVYAATRNSGDTATVGGNISINEGGDTVLGNVETTQAVVVTSGGAISSVASTGISAGSVSLTASGSIGTSGAAVALTGPDTQLSADSGGNIHIGSAGAVTLTEVVASSGTIDVVSAGDLSVTDVRANGAVALQSSGGNITDDGVDASGSRLVASNVSLQAAGSIGISAVAGGLDLQTDSVVANAGGGIFLDMATGDMNVRQIVGGGPVRLQALGGSIVDDAADASAALIDSTAGGIELRAQSSIGTVTDVRTRQGTALAVNTHGGPLVAQVANAGGQVHLNLASGSNPVAGPGSISAGGNGRLLIQSPGDLSLNSFSNAITGFSQIGFSADGILSMPGAQSDLIAGAVDTFVLRGGVDIARADRTFNLSANTVVFESGGQGGAVTLNTTVEEIDATIGNAANLSIVDGGVLTLGTITAGGNVSIQAGEIRDDGDQNGVTRVSGNSIALAATAGIGDPGNRVDTASTALSVQVGTGSAFVSHQGDVQFSGQALGGGIDVETPTGSITVTGTLAAAGPLTLTAGGAGNTGSIVLAGVAQSSAGAVLSALDGGTITDTDDASTHLVAQDATLSASAIGTADNRLSVDVGSITASAAGDVYVSGANALQLRSVGGQTVAIAAGGAITDDGDDSTRVAAQNLTLVGSSIGAAGNAVDTAVDSLSAQATAGGIYLTEAGDVQIATLSAASDSDVALTATGAVTDDGIDSTRISGRNVSLSGTALGGSDPGAQLDIQAASLTASAAAGSVHIAEADDLQLNAIAATGGAIEISAGGVMTDDGDDSTRVTASTVTLAATRIGALDDRLDTAAGSLNASASGGGIYIGELDDVELRDVRSAGTGNTVDVRTSGNGNIHVDALVTQGGAVNLAAGGTGSLVVTGAIESNNGVVNLTSGNALALPGLDTGTGSVILHTVNDLNVGTVTAGEVSITSDTGNVSLGTVNAGNGTVSVTASNGAINDNTSISITAGSATLSARSIGSSDNALNVAVGTLTATTTGGGLFIDDVGGLTLGNIDTAGSMTLSTSGALLQSGTLTSNGNSIALFADSIAMQPVAVTRSSGGSITYVADAGDVNLAMLDAGNGRVLVIAGDSVYNALPDRSDLENLTGAAVEVRAGGLAGSLGEIGTRDSAVTIAAPGDIQSLFLIVPAVNGVQTTTPQIQFTGPTSALLLKGYTGTTGTLFFDTSSAFNADTIIQDGETIVPLRNGRVAVNSDSLSAAKQALSSGVVSRVNIDWAAFDPNVSLFGTLDPATKLPDDQVDELVPAATLIPQGSELLVSREGWRLRKL